MCNNRKQKLMIIFTFVNGSYKIDGEIKSFYERRGPWTNIFSP